MFRLGPNSTAYMCRFALIETLWSKGIYLLEYSLATWFW